MLKHHEQIKKFLKWKKLKEQKLQDSDVSDASKLNLSELYEDVDTVVSKEFSELDSLL